ncbi:MAG: hypothetical protein IKE31_10195 [Eubacterium sp.]|nr:hypothetical protein [Eubacterium sp.]
MMNKSTEQTLRYITRGLTGRRESDIVFLQEKIEEYSFDTRVTAALKRILNCLVVAEMHPAFMTA